MHRAQGSTLAEETFYGELLARLHAEDYADHALGAATKIRDLLAGTEPRCVVDLGCGPGDLLAAFAAESSELLGVDRSPALLAYAARRAPSARLVEASIYDAELPERIDLLCAVGEVVQYGPDPRAGLSGLRWLCTLAGERLAAGGLLAFDLVGPGRVGATASSHLKRELGARTVEVEAQLNGRTLTRRITTTEAGRSETEVHHQEVVTTGEVLSELSAVGLEVLYLAGGYADEELGEPASTIAVIARQR